MRISQPGDQMIHLPPEDLKFNDNVVFTFPTQLCCNCGARTDLHIVRQDTRKTSYLFAGGSEITFSLPLSFCAACAPSAKRRAKNIAHRVLGLIVAFAVTALAQIIIGDLILESPSLAKYLVDVSLLGATGFNAAWIMIGRPKGQQTSYFQPVRIRALKREFVSGIVTAIGFAFTNDDYARAFSTMNQTAMNANVLTVTQA
jgi:hypothetical protein